MTIESAELGKILTTLLDEGYDDPADPRMTWFVDNEAGSGLLGTLSRLDAAEASRPFAAGDAAGAASHAGHLLFALGLANRALRGESVHATADWSRSWELREVDEAAWRGLLDGLRAELAALREAIARDLPWADPMNFTGLLGQLAHGAWHLGAIRQGLGLVKTPRPRAT